jgi:hypothetical protein
VIGTEVASLVFGGEFPAPDMIPRFFLVHVLLLPAVLLALAGLHVAIVVLQRHTQFPGPGRTERNLVGRRFWPQPAVRSASLLLLVAAVCAGLGGLAQINPVWQSGPFEAAKVTSPAQPDWYLGWVDGLLRLSGPWELEVFGYTVSENFWPAIVFPAIAFGVLTLWPWIERRCTGDRAAHHLLDRPRDAPARPYRHRPGRPGAVLHPVPGRQRRRPGGAAERAGGDHHPGPAVRDRGRPAANVAGGVLGVPFAARNPGPSGHPHRGRAPAAFAHWRV